MCVTTCRRLLSGGLYSVVIIIQRAEGFFLEVCIRLWMMLATVACHYTRFGSEHVFYESSATLCSSSSPACPIPV